jgi:hypothetical protein
MPDGLLLTLMNPPEGGVEEFNDWVDTEHVPERLATPGFHTALRFENTGTSPRYLAIYDLDDAAVLDTPAYLAISGPNLSPWSKRILARATNRWRFSGSRVGGDERPTASDDSANHLLLVAWRNVHGQQGERVLAEFRAALDGLPGLRTVRLFAGPAVDKGDYVGVVEASSELPADAVEPARYSSPAHPCAFAHAFVPLAADAHSASRV